MTDDYDRLERDAEKLPTKIADHSEAWAKLGPVGTVNGTARERVETFCRSKRITLDALEQLGTRYRTDRHGGVELAWGYPIRLNGREVVTAVKIRPIDPAKKRYALTPSVFVRPIVAGNVDALDWFAAEGETDAARLLGLVGDVAAVICLPAGAKTFKRSWAQWIPRGATVHLCHDADEAGDSGAEKAARLLGGRTVRVRPPIEGGDWCDYDGGRDEFIEIVAGSRQRLRAYEFEPLAEFVKRKLPHAEPLLGKPGSIYLAVGSLLVVFGAEGTGKSTWTVDGIAHLAAGQDWLGIPAPRPVRFAVIENEGPAELFRAKLEQKAATWEGAPFLERVHVYASPWGEFTFADPAAREALADYCDRRQVDVVVANPTLGLGVAASGRPDETQAFVDWLKQCGLGAARAFWLLHHENKAGQVSGDWGRHPDTVVHLEKDGNRPRTKLTWSKTRWATLPTDGQPKACILEWVVETQGYTVVELDTVGVADDELRRRVDEFLTERPWSSTTTVETEVKGNAKRIRELLSSGRYDSVKGPRAATLWNLSPDPVQGSEDGETGSA